MAVYLAEIILKNNRKMTLADKKILACFIVIKAGDLMFVYAACLFKAVADMVAAVFMDSEIGFGRYCWRILWLRQLIK